MQSIMSNLRSLFNENKLYSIKDLMDITGYNKHSISVSISKLKNDKYCGKKGKLDLVQDIGFYDGIKRWGKRGTKEIYRNG